MCASWCKPGNRCSEVVAFCFVQHQRPQVVAPRWSLTTVPLSLLKTRHSKGSLRLCRFNAVAESPQGASHFLQR